MSEDKPGRWTTITVKELRKRLRTPGKAFGRTGWPHPTVQLALVNGNEVAYVEQSRAEFLRALSKWAADTKLLACLYDDGDTFLAADFRGAQ